MSSPNREEIERAICAVMELPERWIARPTWRGSHEGFGMRWNRCWPPIGRREVSWGMQTFRPELLGKMEAKLARLDAAARVPRAVENSASRWPTDGTPMIGQQLGQYQIVEKLGEGGMGVVYKARDTRLNPYVAVKVLPADRIADPDRKRRFIHEAQAASALNHPNIITVHDIAQKAGVDFIVMESISPERRWRPSSGETVCRLARRCAETACSHTPDLRFQTHHGARAVA